MSASNNLLKTLGLTEPDELIGRSIADKLPDVAPALESAYQNRLHLLTGRYPARIANDRPTWVRLLTPTMPDPSGVWRILEVKPEESGIRQAGVLATLAATAHLCREATNIADLATGVTATIRTCLGCDRVSFCKFDHGNLAYVIAEDRSNDMPACLGLTFPAGTFGPLERQRLIANRVVFEADHAAQRASMLGQALATEDLHRLSLLACAPEHGQLMMLTGARTTLALAIMLQGRLFGVVLCSYAEPRLPGVDVRHAAETFAHLLSSGVDQVWRREHDRQSSEGRSVRRALLASAETHTNLGDVLRKHAAPLRNALAACNVLHVAEHMVHQFPQAHAQMPREQLSDLADFLRTQLGDGRDFYWTTELVRHIPALNVVRGVAGGVTALRLPDSIVAIIRPELIRSPRWVHDALKPKEDAASRTGQSSGEHSIVRGTSADWSEEDVAFVEDLRDGLLRFEVQRLQRTAQEMRTSMQHNEAMETILAQLSHELRNPMNPILGWSERLLENEPDRDELRLGLRAIRRNARVQARLIDNLFDTSRIKLGSMEVTREPVDLQAIIQTAVDVVERPARKKAIDIELDVDANLGTLLLDRARMSQVFWNLLSNAVSHCPPHSKVWVTAARLDKTLVIEVEDTGPGVEPQALRTIFDRFSQAAAGRSPNEGLGLGLAIVKGIVELHGGHITAANTGKGLRFRIELPVLETTHARDNAGESQGPLKGYRIMLVDDAEDSLELAAAVLRGEGANLHLFTSAPSALESLSEDIDVLISDLGMPEMHGLDFITQVRERGHTMPAIALTAYRATKDRVASLRAGFQMHLGKPISNEELVLSVLQLVGLSSANASSTR